MKKITEESGSVIIDRVGSVKIGLTSTNRLFVVQGNQIAFPHLQGSSLVKFDDHGFSVGAKVEARIRELLRKQKHIRMNFWPDPEEEKIAWEYN